MSKDGTQGPKRKRRQPWELPQVVSQATSATPSGTFAPVMKATASDIE